MSEAPVRSEIELRIIIAIETRVICVPLRFHIGEGQSDRHYNNAKKRLEYQPQNSGETSETYVSENNARMRRGIPTNNL